MVATKISEVAAKGYEYVYGQSGSDAGPKTPLRSNATPGDANSGNSFLSTPSSLWDVASSSLSSASSSLSNAAEEAYSTVTGYANYAWQYGNSEARTTGLTLPSGVDQQQKSSWLQTVAERDHTPFGSPLKIHNPYSRVRGRYQNRSSVNAVRSLLPLVEETYPLIQEIEENDESEVLTGESEDSNFLQDADSSPRILTSPPAVAQRRSSNPYTPDPEFRSPPQAPASQVHKNSETASQLAEGTVRALRDIALDEAVDLYSALRFWSERWEHPLLSWFEAGPTGRFKL